MEQDTQKATPEKISKPRQAINAIKNSKSYADLQHFCKTKLQYTQIIEMEKEQSFVLGYN